jgi:hypothetical protein
VAWSRPDVARRDAAQELYDHACELVDAAAGLAGAAHAPEIAAVAPAVLGCLEAVCADLRTTVALLAAADASQQRPAEDAARRAQQGYSNLGIALHDARVAAAAARALAARSRPDAGG